MSFFQSRAVVSALAVLVLTACGGSSGGGGDGGATEPTDPAVEGTDPSYVTLETRSDADGAGMIYVVLEGATPSSDDNVNVTYSSGALSGGALDGEDLDTATFFNPANGEYSRVFLISRENENLFGVVGLDVLSGDLPETETVITYNEGWVGMTAFFEDRAYVLEGDASFTASFGTGDLSGRFFNLSGNLSEEGSLDQTVTSVGTIDLTGANITADQFLGGNVTGTGIFAGLGGTSSTGGTQGAFFGPLADELGGVLMIDDLTQDILVIGAFQAD